MDGAFPLGNRALRMLLRLLEVALDNGHTFNPSPGLGGKHFEDFAFLALVSTGNNDDLIATFDMKFRQVKGPPERAR